MNYKELKRFYFSKPPTGSEIAELVQVNNLHTWEVEIVKAHLDSTGVYVMPGNLYRYEITFSRMVS